jgi:hypothetical protein
MTGCSGRSHVIRDGVKDHPPLGNLDPTGVIAVRLDVLKDERLPGNGPGRHETGSFHLAEISLEVADVDASDGTRLVPFARAWPTHSWHSRPVKRAIDGNKDTPWHIWGRLDVSHTAIFYLPEPFPTSDVEQLTVRLVNGGEAEIAPLGRFRLSIQRTPSTDGVSRGSIDGLSHALRVLGRSTPHMRRTSL